MPRTATGCGRFSSYFTCLHTTAFILLSIFSLVETISLKIWERPLSWHAKCSLPISVRCSKTSTPIYVVMERAILGYNVPQLALTQKKKTKKSTSCIVKNRLNVFKYQCIAWQWCAFPSYRDLVIITALCL